MRTIQSGAGQTSRGEPSSSQPLGSMNEYINVVDDVEVDLHSEDISVRDRLQAQRAEEDNLENNPIYVEGEQEVMKPLKRLMKTITVKRMMTMRKK